MALTALPTLNIPESLVTDAYAILRESFTSPTDRLLLDVIWHASNETQPTVVDSSESKRMTFGIDLGIGPSRTVTMYRDEDGRWSDSEVERLDSEPTHGHELLILTEERNSLLSRRDSLLEELEKEKRRAKQWEQSAKQWEQNLKEAQEKHESALKEAWAQAAIERDSAGVNQIDDSAATLPTRPIYLPSGTVVQAKDPHELNPTEMSQAIWFVAKDETEDLRMLRIDEICAKKIRELYASEIEGFETTRRPDLAAYKQKLRVQIQEEGVRRYAGD